MKKKKIILVFTILLAIVFASCKSDEDETSGTVGGKTQNEETNDTKTNDKNSNTETQSVEDPVITIGKTISIPSDAASATITDTILALTGDTTLKFSGAINAVKLKAIASAMKENDSVQISLDFSETTGITEWKNWFAEIESLYGIALPKTVTTIEGGFYRCKKLTAVSIPSSVTQIKNVNQRMEGNFVYYDGSFEDTNIKYINYVGSLSDWLTISRSEWRFEIPYNAELYIDGNNVKEITEITIPENVTSIAGGSFDRWSSLKSIIIPDWVSGWVSFTNCSSLSSVSLGKNVTSFRFANCPVLTNLTVKGDISSLATYSEPTIETLYINADIPDRMFTSYSYRKLKRVIIGDDCTSIGHDAFEYLHTLEEITIPKSVKKIAYGAFDNAFSKETEAKKKVFYTGTADDWAQIDFGYGNDKYDWQSNPIAYADEFYCNGTMLTEAEFSSSEIKNYAFYNYKKLVAVTLGSNVTNIGSEAFTNTYIKTLFYTDSFASYVGNTMLLSCEDLHKHREKLYINGKVLSGDLILPDTLTAIAPYMFKGCNELTSVTIPSSVTKIGTYAFFGCAFSNTVVTIPASVNFIGSYAFYPDAEGLKFENINKWKYKKENTYTYITLAGNPVDDGRLYSKYKQYDWTTK